MTETLTRPHSPALDAILGHEHKALDHGFLRVVDYMGDEPAIVQAARVSYGTGTKAVQADRGLIRYLMRHRHSSPLEMCEIKLHVKLPIFVARQWIRHRMASVNEYSARYSILDSEFYLPDPAHVCAQSADNKQGRGDVLDPSLAREVSNLLWEDAMAVQTTYRTLIAEDGSYGLSRELARIGLTLSTYTQWYWKIDLHNLLHFLSLRLDHHAQYEIRVYAEIIMGIVRQWAPNVVEAFEDYRLHAHTFSRQEMQAIRDMLASLGAALPEKIEGVTKREMAAFRLALGVG